jgi:serine/threonine-protein kinase
VVAVICPSCDREPAPDATAGRVCPTCGAPLVRVDDSEDLVGTVVAGRFEIIAKLGQGGMGTVYRARQRSMSREIALKVIDRRFQDNVVAVKRFFREVQLAAQLTHPNIVAALDFGTFDDGRLYFAMELVPGTTLHAALQAGPMPPERVARIGIQLCDAIEAAHALGIVHRDLKLENVMLLERDLVKVLDFGLARSLDGNERATATGMITGTPRYMAPEAVTGAPPSPAQDLYALGVMLGELVTGRALWDAPTFESMLARKLEPVALPGVAPPIAQLVKRLVDANPAARPTVGETRAALEAMRGERSVSAPITEFTIDPAKLVHLDARDGEAPARPKPTRPPTPPPMLADVAPKIEAKFELEPEWQQERAARASASPPTAPPRTTAKAVHERGSIGGVIAAIVAVAIVAGVIVFFMRRTREPEVHAPDGVAVIQIIAPKPGDVTLDGVRVGKTPLRLNLPKTGRKVRVEVGGETSAAFDLVPDRDRVIDLAKPATIP